MLRQVSMELLTANELQRVAKEHEVKLSVKDCRDFNSKGMTMLLEIEGQRDGVSSFVQHLKGIVGVRHVYESFPTPEKAICLTVLDRPLQCSASLESGVVCLECPFDSSAERPTWEVLVRRSEDLKQLVSTIEKGGIGVKITRISEVNHGESLTSRQKEILLAAISNGYFDFPRKTSLSELSEKVGVKPSTLSEILRSAERRIMLRYGEQFNLRRAPASIREPF